MNLLAHSLIREREWQWAFLSSAIKIFKSLPNVFYFWEFPKLNFSFFLPDTPIPWMSIIITSFCLSFVNEFFFFFLSESQRSCERLKCLEKHQKNFSVYCFKKKVLSIHVMQRQCGRASGYFSLFLENPKNLRKCAGDFNKFIAILSKI